ncbi:MAG: 2-amino-4-hydroxy-6-hydroxymethyldihydropteridine diphosphokinase [Synergistaceae bacterium]|jgi:2-amino-4-hydroxy-6-hydroxymethyldihydropteridine diphosphokinase|nr:2-amino-4-hydroxy-6-hydroxymethyldihydropteridine diphosphokinase [Synergistaceae bacterium]
MNLCALSLGSNIGNRLANIRKAAELLEDRVGTISAKSEVYETAPWGLKSQPRFLNACVLLETELSPHGLLSETQAIEREIGRIARERWGPREIDIDILTYGDTLLNEEKLVIPHPLMSERAFVLVPMSDIARDFVHPSDGTSIGDFLARTGREGIVRVVSL